MKTAIGICKGRFRLLTRPLECAAEDVTRVMGLVVVICTLHNFLIDVHDDTEIVQELRKPEESFETRTEGDLVSSEQDDHLNTTRNVLWRHIRWVQAEDDGMFD